MLDPNLIVLLTVTVVAVSAAFLSIRFWAIYRILSRDEAPYSEEILIQPKRSAAFFAVIAVIALSLTYVLGLFAISRQIEGLSTATAQIQIVITPGPIETTDPGDDQIGELSDAIKQLADAEESLADAIGRLELRPLVAPRWVVSFSLPLLFLAIAIGLVLLVRTTAPGKATWRKNVALVLAVLSGVLGLVAAALPSPFIPCVYNFSDGWDVERCYPPDEIAPTAPAVVEPGGTPVVVVVTVQFEKPSIDLQVNCPNACCPSCPLTEVELGVCPEPGEKCREPSPTPYCTGQSNVCQGISLTIPDKHPAASERVDCGETLTSIAKKHQVTIAELIDANRDIYPSLEEAPDCLLIGWWLIIP